jgi:predicted nucleotidyltransferase
MRSHNNLDLQEIVGIVLNAFPDTEAIYLFGSYAAGVQHPESDLDLAILLPYTTAFKAGSLFLSPLYLALDRQAPAGLDLINLRLVSTVFQVEIINTGHRIYCIDQAQCTDFEALTLSLYQKLNEERAAIIEQIYATGRIYEP